MQQRDPVWEQFRSLPAEARRQAAAFIAFLAARQAPRPPHPARDEADPGRTGPLEGEPFIGIWTGRAEMEDSNAWVRRSREREWAA